METQASFNTQPPEGGWLHCCCEATGKYYVSTHSRPKAAGRVIVSMISILKVSTHSRPKAAAPRRWLRYGRNRSFNTQPPEGGCLLRRVGTRNARRFNTQPPEGGCFWRLFVCLFWRWFQHTAARRRLVSLYFVTDTPFPVSTHSRPKAAGASLKSLAPSGFAAPILLSSQEKHEREYNTAFSVTPAFTIS